MATALRVHALTWAMALGLPLLTTACDRRDTVTPPVSQAGSDVGGRGLVMGDASAPMSTASGTTGVDGSGGSANAVLPPGQMDESLPSPAAGHGALKPLSEVEQQFMRQALESGLYEVAVAALAVERAQSDGTRKMAQQLLSDHRMANDKLQQLANGRMTVPTDIPADKQATIDKLSQARGADFDRQFLEVVGIKDHERDVQLFESAQKDIQDPELKLFVQSTLPTLKHHLSNAQDLRKVRKSEN